jgi:hypothetical protein
MTSVSSYCEELEPRRLPMPATHEDAQLIVQLVRWGTEMGLDEALAVIMAETFDAEKVSADQATIRKALSFGETVATLVKQGLLNQELVIDLWWVEGIWSRVGPAAKRQRERLGEPRLYENFEALAASTS